MFHMFLLKQERFSRALKVIPTGRFLGSTYKMNLSSTNTLFGLLKLIWLDHFFLFH
jgi:hypothetical protein